MSNITLEYGKEKLEIISKMSVLQFDKVMRLQKKYEQEEIWDFEVTFRTALELLVDKSKAHIVEWILNWEMSWDILELMWVWADQMEPILQKAIDTKKKQNEVQNLSSGNIKKQ